MSVFVRITDSTRTSRHVRKVPLTEVRRTIRSLRRRAPATSGALRRRFAFAVFRLKDDCAVLGLARDADPDAIRPAYRALAKKYRPDASVTENAELATSFREISEAYSVLFLVALGCDLTCCAAKAHSRILVTHMERFKAA